MDKQREGLGSLPVHNVTGDNPFSCRERGGGEREREIHTHARADM